MKTTIASRGLIGARLLTALLLLVGTVLAGARSVSAQDDESGLDDNTFTGPNFGWSVEWDEDVWTVDGEDNSGGGDFLALSTVGDPFAIARFFGIADFVGDPDACVEGYAETLAGFDENTDVEESDEFDLPEGPDDGAAATYTYLAELDEGDIEIVDYVSCQPVIEDEAVLIFTITTTPNVFDDFVDTIDDLAAEITLPDDSDATTDDDEQTDGDDEDAGTDDESDATDDEDTSTDDDDADAEPTRDVLLGDDEDDEATGTDDEDATDDAGSDDAGVEDEDEDTAQADSGIDDTAYTSPTYGYAMEWDDDIWTVDPAAEVIDDGPIGLDRVLLRHEDEDGLYASLYVDGKTDYDGDPDDCLEGEADLLTEEDTVQDLELVEDDDGEPLTGESDLGGTYGIYVGSVEADNGDAVDLNIYVECLTIEEDESVAVITLIAAEANFEDELDLATEIFDTIELDSGTGGGSSADDDTNADAADDQDAESDEPADDDPGADDGSDESEDDESARVLTGFQPAA